VEKIMKMKREHLYFQVFNAFTQIPYASELFSWVPGSENPSIVTNFCINLMYYYMESHKPAPKIGGTPLSLPNAIL
jgi:hypothetical protein